MADSGKLLEAPAPRSRVASVSMPAQSKPKKVHYPFWFGGSASCFAAGVTHPLDLGKSSSHTFYTIFVPLLTLRLQSRYLQLSSEICPSTLPPNSVADIVPRRTLGPVTNTRARCPENYVGHFWTYRET